MKKLLYPILWLLDMFKYSSHLDMQRFNTSGYDPYDFTQDLTYGVEPPLYWKKMAKKVDDKLENPKNPTNSFGPK